VDGFGLMPDFFTQSDSAGNFDFNLPGRFMVALVASDATGERMGFLTNYFDTRNRQRLVLRKSRAIPVTVVDGKDWPVAGAKVFAGFFYTTNRIGPRQLLEKSTGADGKVVLRVPSDFPLDEVLCLKPGTGFDYVNYDRPEVQRAHGNRPGRPKNLNERASDDDRPIRFVLGGVHKFRVHLVDQRRRPLSGVRVVALVLERPNRGGRAGFLIAVPEFGVVSDQAGIAEFRAIPAEATWLSLQSMTSGYSGGVSANLDPGDPQTDLTLVVARLPVLRVQVSWPDGRPALGARIDGTTRYYPANRRGRSLSSGIARSYDAAGEIAAASFSNDAYCVVSARSKGFVSTTETRVARIDEPMRPVHLVLQPAVHVHGRLTWGKDHQPDANDAVTLVERDDHYAKLPEEERLPRTLPRAELAHVAIDIPHHATTDAQGRFDFEVAPGRYVIGAGAIYPMSQGVDKSKDVALLFDEATREFEITDQKQIEVNLEREDLSTASSGEAAGPRGLDRIRVQVTYPDGRPAGDARTHFVLCPVAGARQTTANGFGGSGGSHIAISGDAYCVVSATSDAFASAVVARIARKGHPVEPVHLILKPAARVHGKLTEGKTRRPLAHEGFVVIQRDEDNYSKLPAGERLPQFRRITANIPIRRGTDDEGRYEFSAAPGRYVLVPELLRPGSGTNPEDLKTLVDHGAKEFQVKDEKDIELNVHRE
jgi:hypothetical protein